ncbi:MAG: hypothetical protein IJB91_03585 [Oscillospiraceae bacterium]|nr:hypothetical protein [Oscillospiraceae bacterium]
MATYQATTNRRRTVGSFTPTEDRRTGVGAFTPTENRSYDSAIVYGWERQNKEAYDILEQYRNKISSGGYLSAEDLAAYKNAADIYTKTSTDLWNLSKNLGQDQKMDDASFRNSMAALQQNYTDVYNYYSKFENEAAYQEAYQANQVYQGHLNADLGQLQTEMDVMKPVVDEASEIYAQIGSFNPYAYADSSQAMAAEQALKDRLAEITSPWGGYEQMQAAYSEKEQYYNLSKRYQEWAKLEDVVNNADFEAKSKFVGPSKNGAQEDDQYDVIYDEDYEYWLENHYDEWYDPNNDIYDHFTYMTPEEKAIFIYHYNTGGKTAADEYDKSIQDRQNKRWADERTALDNGSTMAALKAHFWAAVGNLGRQIKGTWNMVTGSDEYIPTGQFEYYGANAREELADDGPKLFGHSLGQLAFDFLQNTANQAPSMAIGAVAGPGAGSAALGIGAAGNAYADMINAGYSKGQARTYATLVGGSEAGLSYLLDAIPYFGGKLSSKITSSILDKVDNVLARVAIKMGSNFGSEALEEGLQAVLEPWFKEVATNIQQDRPDWEEVAYESLLGGLSGLVLGGPGNIAETVNTSRTGQQLMLGGVTAQDLTNLGMEFDADSAQYALAQGVNDRISSGKKVNAYTMGRMWQDFSTEMTAQNTAALTQALQEQGLTAKQANNLVEYFFSLTEEAQAIVMENSRELAEAVQSVLLNPETQAGRRTQAYNVVQNKLSGRPETKTTAKEAPKVSQNGKTYRTDTGEAVESLQIESVGNGKITYNMGDKVVDKSEIEYANEQEAMLHEAMSKSRTLTVRAANFMAQHVDSQNPSYINEAIDAYQAGWYGYSESKLDSFNMPKSQSYELYAYGKKAREEYDAKQKQAQSEAKAAAEAGTKSKGTRGVYFTDMKGHTVAFDEANQSLSKAQKVGVDTAKFLNELGLGGEIVFFKSEKVNGKWVFRDSKGNLHSAPNGMYTGKDGRIYIDLNTFAGSKGATLYTLAHELTHFIENNAPAQYKVLADFLINEYDKTGKSMDERVKAKQKELEYLWDRDVSYDEAFREVVADSMQKLFNDGNLQNELVKLKESSPEGARVVQAIKNFLDNLIKRIRNIYAKLSTGSEEAETVAQMGESLQKLQKIFAAALVEASDNYTAYGAVDSEGIQQQAKPSTKNPDKLDPRTVSKADVLELLKKVENGDIYGNTYIPVRINTPATLIYWAKKKKGDIIDNNPIAISADKAYNAMTREGEENGRLNRLSPKEIIAMIEGMNDPRYIVYQNVNDRYVLVVEFGTESGDKAFAVIEIGNNKDSVYMNGYEGGLYNILVTTYPPKTGKLKELLKNSNNEVIYEKKKDAPQRTSGSTVPSVLNDASFYEEIIPEEIETVKQKDLADTDEVISGDIDVSDNIANGRVQMQARATVQQLYPEYNKPISIQDVHTLRSIGRKSVNQFSAEDLKKSQKWAHKYYMDLGAKSPFFRAWFGDWRMYDGALVAIAKIPEMVLGKSEFKAFLKQQRGSVINKDTKKSTGDGWEIRISGDGERNTVAHSGGGGLSVDALTAIRELIENGILLDTEVHEHHSNNSKTPATDRIAFDHRLYSLGMNPDNSISLYRITIEEIFQDPKHPNDKRFHNLKYIEKVADSIPGLTYADLHSADTVRDESTTRYSVADLYNLVKSNDPEFNYGKPSSLIVSADGTPKVMYHGSGAQFTVFDRSKAKSSGMYGKGFYFTDSAEQAGVYGNLYSVYLNVKHPLQYGKDTVSRLQVRRFLETVAKNEDYSIENYGTYDVNAILNTIMGGQNSGDAFQIIQDVSATAIGDMVEAAELFNSINNTKYDGITVPTETVVFRPEQVKSATDNVGTFDPANQDIRYQARPSEETSNRYLLANALESAAQTDEERQKLQQYRDQIQNAEDLEDRLDKLNRRIFEYSFAPGPRDTAKLNEMRETAKRMARQLDRMDKRLLGLEATKPMKDLLERERKLERQRTAEKYREASQRRTEGRQKTEMRHKVQKAVKKLNDLLLHESKDKHIPEGMKSAVSEILDAINMDTVDAESRIRDLEAQLEEAMKAGKTKLVQDISRRIDNVRNAGDKIGEQLSKLHTEYEKIQKESDPVLQNAYDEVLSGILEELVETVGETPIRNMTMTQLEKVYEAVKAVSKAVRDANKTFLEGRRETVQQLSVNTQNEVKSVGGEHIKAVTSMAGMKRFGWSLLKPIYAMRAIGSNTLTKLYENIRKGEDVWAVDVTEARDYYRDMVKKYGYDGWDLKKQHTFKSTTGREFQLNLEQIMSLYALSRRDQALEHLQKGGFVYDSQTEVVERTKLGVPIKYTINTANAYNLSPEILAEIVGTLTKEQQGFVEDMQSYLSNELAQKGNTVSMALYDLKLFKEKNYFPLRSADQYLQKKNEPAGHVKLKNSGFSKKTTPRATNPIVLGSFTEVWSEHVNDMSMYHAFVLPIEDFNRVYNFNSGKAKENVNTESVKGAIQNAYGRQANKYISKLLEDINGGARSDPDAGIINKLVGLHKKGAVYLSASVVVQQPSALVRAQALIDPIHFIGPKIEGKRRKATWEEVKKWAPIALIKEMGRFDINMGKSTVEYIKGKEYDSFGEKFAGFFKDKNYREDILSRAPALADEISWCYIWNAVKRETAKQNPDLDPSSDAFFQKAGERFTEVITRTQVYDSVLSRSQIMRSKDSGVKMITSFYAEPNTSLNMAVDAVLQHKRGVKGGIRRTWGAVAASQILNAFLVSFVYAARDDDEDETYLEKYIGRFASEALDSFNPMGYLPILRDILSVFQGYTVERSDMTIVGDIIDAVAKLSNKDLSAWKKIEGMIGSVSQFTGIPVKNLLRDGNALYNLFYTGEGISNTTARGIWKSFVEELTKKDYSNARQLYSAVLAGDEKQTERVLARYEDRNAAITAFQNVLRDEFEDGNIDTSDAEELLIIFAGLKAEDAEVKVDYWETKNERGTDLTLSSYTTWYRELKDAGVTLDVYEDFKKQFAEIESDKDKDGEPISGSKKKKIVALIDSLQISDEQKDALYLSCNYAESTLNSTPWH